MTAALLPRRTVVAAGAAFALGGHARAGDQPGEPTPGIHDLMPDFWRFYDADIGGDFADRAQSLDLQFITRNADIYFAAGFGRDGPHQSVTDGRLASWLAGFDALAPAARRVSQMLPDAWREHEVRFRRTFPTYRPDASIFLMVSLFSFNADARPWRGRERLFIGVDGMVQQAGGQLNVPVLLDHEAFHLYHLQADPGLWPKAAMQPLWVRLWREGLATLVSARLNPDAAAAEVLMSADLAALPPTELQPVAAQALAALDTTDLAEAHRFFDLGYVGDIPARSGYLLGYRLAERAGRSLSLDQLARLPAPKVHRFLREELGQIARG